MRGLATLPGATTSALHVLALVDEEGRSTEAVFRRDGWAGG